MSGDEAHEPSPAIRVVESVAAARGVRTVELDPLSDRLDLEAMDQLFENSSVPIRVECVVDDLVVTVDTDGGVDVSPAGTD
jgi:hypothetical protein